MFDQFGGSKTAGQAGFVAGYKGNYVSPNTSEALAITVLQFRSPQTASAYFLSTIPTTLSLSAPVQKRFPSIPGAVEVDATKSYNQEYAHGVVMTRGLLYAQVFYFTVAPSTVPIEFPSWAVTQYALLAHQP